jgi:transcription initiation factor IIF auxiliary subunit
MRVTSTDLSKPLVNRVRFHLHDTFSNDVVTVKPKNDVAEITRYAWGAFTVGAEVENEPDTYLELDLAEDPDAPANFRKR